MDVHDGTVVQGRFSWPFGQAFETTIRCRHDEMVQTLGAGIQDIRSSIKPPQVMFSFKRELGAPLTSRLSSEFE